MPTYEYECPNCGTFEVSQRMTDAPLSQHGCGAPVSRTIPKVAFSLKGGGWYADGYGASSRGKDKGDGESCKPGGCAKPECPASAEAN